MLRRLIYIAFSFLLVLSLQAQDSTRALQFPSAYLDKISSKANSLEQKLDKKADKALQQMMKQEEKMKRMLAKIDSFRAKEIFGSAEQKYKELEHRLQGNLSRPYIASLDTMITSLKFLQQNPRLISQVKDRGQKLNEALDNVKGLEDRFQKAEEIKKFLRERKQFLREKLSQLGFAKELKRINKVLFYYSEQVNEYKAMLKDHKKAESKFIELLSKTKLFRDFMKSNSMLASFFPMPGGGVNGQSTQATGFAALQSRAQINSFLQQTNISGINTMSRFQQNIQDAESQLIQLRNKLSQSSGANGDDLDMPDFKPNSQKTKSFLKRLEYGTTFQSQKANRFFPATSDLGLSVGYKLNDKSIIGVSATYKIGWGTGWNNIKLSSQGIGLRSFFDWKIKGTLWISGGYEQNYRTLFNSIDQLKDLNAWQQSGLLGLSKAVTLKSKFFKKTKLQFLWDFLSSRQKPQTQPLLFRVGYNF